MASMTDDAVLVRKQLNSAALSKRCTAGVDTCAYESAHKAWRKLSAHSTAETTDMTRTQLLADKCELLNMFFKLRTGALEARVSELQEAASRTKALVQALERSRKNDAKQTKVQACVRQVAVIADSMSDMVADMSKPPINAPAKRHSETEVVGPATKQTRTAEPAQSQHPGILA